MYWQDERLAYINTGYKKRLALNAKMVQHMWIPDIYFVNEKSGIKHDLTKENEVVRLWPDGRVFHSMRYVTPKSVAVIQPPSLPTLEWVCTGCAACFDQKPLPYLHRVRLTSLILPYPIYDLSKTLIPVYD